MNPCVLDEKRFLPCSVIAVCKEEPVVTREVPQAVSAAGKRENRRAHAANGVARKATHGQSTAATALSRSLDLFTPSLASLLLSLEYTSGDSRLLVGRAFSLSRSLSLCVSCPCATYRRCFLLLRCGQCDCGCMLPAHRTSLPACLPAYITHPPLDLLRALTFALLLCSAAI